jgi:hypothetical protein
VGSGMNGCAFGPPMIKDGGVAARAFETAYAACARLSGLGWRAGGITTMLEPDEEFVGLEGTFGALFNPAIRTPPLTPEREAARKLLSPPKCGRSGNGNAACNAC